MSRITIKPGLCGNAAVFFILLIAINNCQLGVESRSRHHTRAALTQTSPNPQLNLNFLSDLFYSFVNSTRTGSTSEPASNVVYGSPLNILSKIFEFVKIREVEVPQNKQPHPTFA